MYSGWCPEWSCMMCKFQMHRVRDAQRSVMLQYETDCLNIHPDYFCFIRDRAFIPIMFIIWEIEHSCQLFLFHGRYNIHPDYVCFMGDRTLIHIMSVPQEIEHTSQLCLLRGRSSALCHRSERAWLRYFTQSPDQWILFNRYIMYASYCNIVFLYCATNVYRTKVSHTGVYWL